MERKEFKNGSIVSTDNCAYLDIYSIMIDRDEKTVELNDFNGFVKGLIHYADENVEILTYDQDGNLASESEVIEK